VEEIRFQFSSKKQSAACGEGGFAFPASLATFSQQNDGNDKARLPGLGDFT
jgi:hypothetical protein